jgi:hypothetical protein
VGKSGDCELEIRGGVPERLTNDTMDSRSRYPTSASVLIASSSPIQEIGLLLWARRSHPECIYKETANMRTPPSVPETNSSGLFVIDMCSTCAYNGRSRATCPPILASLVGCREPDLRALFPNRSNNMRTPNTRGGEGGGRILFALLRTQPMANISAKCLIY